MSEQGTQITATIGSGIKVCKGLPRSYSWDHRACFVVFAWPDTTKSDASRTSDAAHLGLKRGETMKHFDYISARQMSEPL